ncbi:MAG: hypothetical protein JWM37_278 [Candidatus Saccharibacteria bacterium]|nr:hypothetical protein [Candidatus Saccharibacteria bacterium]
MASLSKAGRLFAVSAVAVFSALTVSTGPVLADTLPTNMVTGQVLEYSPLCSDASAGLSLWQVNNKNTDAVSFTWDNVEHGVSDTVSAPNGVSQFVTYYDATDPNNRTVFTAPSDEVSRNAQTAACDHDLATCVDGSVYGNLMVSFTAKDQAVVNTKNNLPLCEDVVLNFSSYIMPDNYDGNGFENNSTATPQDLFYNSQTTLAAGSVGPFTLTTQLPDNCKNIQVDVYYGPEVKNPIGPQGHAGVGLLGDIYPSTGACQPTGGMGGGESQPPVTPPTGGMGGGEITAPVANAPAPVATTPVVGGKGAGPAVLADTGSSLVAPYLTALAILLASGSIVLFDRKANR